MAALAGVMVAGCSTDVGDQVCTEESIERDRDDDCPYGPPGGPSVQITGDGFCPDPPVIDEAGPGCDTATFGSVYAMFEKPIDPDGGNCVDSKCHGVAAAGDTPKFFPAMIQRDPENPQDALGPTYDSLQKWGIAKYGRPYIRGVDAEPSTAGSPEQAWILCNLQGQRGLIMPSPTGFKSDAPLATVRAWVDCGMKKTLEAGAGGAGGGAGVGGAGGVPIGGGGGVGGQ